MTFQWSGLPQALWVLCEEGKDTNSGAFVAGHLGSLNVVASKARSTKNRRNRWTTFALTWEHEHGGTSSWLTTLVEIALLIGHGAVQSSARGLGVRLLPVQVAGTNY